MALVLTLGALGALGSPAFATTLRPGLKPQWTYAQFVLNDRMTLSVNVESGNLNLAARDISVGGNLGPKADLWRFYNSLVLNGSDLGNGWLTNAGPDVRLVGTYGSDMMFYGPTGYQAPFAWNGTGGYKLATGIGGQLTHNTDGSWEIWMYRQAIKYEFSATGLFTSSKDMVGNALTFGYSAGALTSLVSQQGLTDTIGETSGLITGATAPPSSAARTWGYARDANGNLHTYTGPDGYVTTYSYDAGVGHHLTQIDDPEGRRTIVSYDTSGRATSVKQVTNNSTNVGDTTTFVYTGSIVVGGVTYGGKTVVTDPNGHATTYYSDMTDTGDVLRTDDPLGHVHYGQWTTNDDPKQTTDALAHSTNYRYTDQGTTYCGRLTNDFMYRPCLQAATNSVASSEGYGDVTNPYLPTNTTDSRGVSMVMGYASYTGLLTQVTDGDSGITSFLNNANGTVATVTNPKTNPTTYSYYTTGTAIGSLENIITNSTFSATESFGYDGADRVVCLGSDATNGLSLINYDDYDRPTYENFERGCEPSYDPHSDRTYDKSGNLKSLATYDASGVLVANTAYTYDAKNRLTQEAQTAPFAATTSYTYDGADNLKTIVNADGTTTYNYDASDRLTSVVEPGPFTTTFGYNSADQRTSTTYPNGVAENYTVDANGNITRLTAVKGTTTLLDLEYNYCLSACGGGSEVDSSNLQSLKNDLSSHDTVATTTTYHYDGNGWLTEANTINTTTLATINDAKWTYDADGNRTSQQINGGTVQSVPYNNDDMAQAGGAGVCSDTYPHGYSWTNDTGVILCYQRIYDERNQLETGFGFSHVDNYTYAGDDNTNITSTGTDNWTNDQLGVARKITGTTSTDYLRDLSGQHIGQRTGTTRYYYITDALGSVLAVTDSTGAVVNNYTYDAWGKPLTATGQTTNEIPFRWVGAQWRPNAGLYHLGARFYDPFYARFTQTDPGAMYDEPGMGSRYAYAGDDPVNSTDPSGENGGHDGWTASPGACRAHPARQVQWAGAYMSCKSYKALTHGNNSFLGSFSAKVAVIFGGGCTGAILVASAAGAPETLGGSVALGAGLILGCAVAGYAADH